MTHGGSAGGRNNNGRAQPPATISIRGLESGPRLTPNSLSAKTRPLSAIVDRLDVEIENELDDELEEPEVEEPEVSVVPPSPMSPSVLSAASATRFVNSLIKMSLICIPFISIFNVILTFHPVYDKGREGLNP